MAVLVSDISSSGVDRLNEAGILANANSPLASSYLAGYSAEIVLKKAICSLRKADPADSLLQVLREAWNTFEQEFWPAHGVHGFVPPPSAYDWHDHQQLVAVIIELRYALNIGWERDVASEYVRQAQRLRKYWTVEIRYLPSSTTKVNNTVIDEVSRWFVSKEIELES